MTPSHLRRPRLLAALAASALAAFAIAATVAAAGDSVSGRFSSVAVAAPDCTSPIGLCTAGTLTGALKGSFAFTGTALIPTADTPATGVVLYTGEVVVNTADGRITCKDAGALQTTGDGPVASVCVVVSGTGAYGGASGYIRFAGTFTATVGGDGRYEGRIIVP